MTDIMAVSLHFIIQNLNIKISFQSKKCDIFRDFTTEKGDSSEGKAFVKKMITMVSRNDCNECNKSL